MDNEKTSNLFQPPTQGPLRSFQRPAFRPNKFLNPSQPFIKPEEVFKVTKNSKEMAI